jgi:hypothetical protein
MKPLSATQRRHLEDAVKSVDALGLTGASAAAQIQHLKVHHGARATQISKGHALACAGVRSTSTWSDGYVLLVGWLRLARRRLTLSIPTDQETAHG